MPVVGGAPPRSRMRLTVTYVPVAATVRPTPIMTPPAVLRNRFSEQPVDVHLPIDASTANPAAAVSAPAMAPMTGPVSAGGGGGGGRARAGVDGVASPMLTRQAAARRRMNFAR